MLEINGITKYFGDLAAVNTLSFRVDGGEIVGLLGPNGAGKTTTIRCIAGILSPDYGNVTLCGRDIVREPEAAKRHLAYVPEVPNPYEMLTVMEHLRFVAAAFDTEAELARADELLDALDLLDKRNAVAASLSKGMRQKLACACAFVHRADIFCFDEPLVGIDPKGARSLKDLLQRERDAGKALLISTHQLDTAERLCDRVVIMHKGSLVTEGTMEELHQTARLGENATLEDMFLELTEEVT
ncbi:MAG TPA: ABC transporter ATP-binding protein [Armatimonadota bacterium]|jgi:ABC-2 type transport system ATP-binding protein